MSDSVAKFVNSVTDFVVIELDSLHVSIRITLTLLTTYLILQKWPHFLLVIGKKLFMEHTS